MRKTVWLIVAVWLVSTGVAPARAQVATPADGPVVVAQGESVLMVVPDRAYVSLAAEARAPKIADAQHQAAAAMTSLQSAVKALGFAPDMMRTTSYVVQPEYDVSNGRQIFRDYLARNVIEVRVDDLARLADVIDAAGSSGAASVSSLRFDLKDRGAVELDALGRAVRDARDRAQAMAVAAGRALGAIVRLQEQRSSSASPVFRAAGAAGGRGGGGGFVQTPIEPGEIEVRAQVTLTMAVR